MKRTERHLFKIAHILSLKYADGALFTGPLLVKDEDNILVPATDEQRRELSSDIMRLAQTAVSGKSLKQLHAQPIAEDDLPMNERLKTSLRFKNEGNVEDSFGQSPSGLPRFNIDPDGETYLVTGRHRLTVAREIGRNTIVARLVKRDHDGWILWEAELPITI